jgi:hypothetical protein
VAEETMTKEQEYVFWIGLGLLMVYLFTNTSFKQTIFGTAAKVAPKKVA